MARISFFAFLCSLLLFTTLSHADLIGVNILSESHNITGAIYPNDLIHWGDNYEISSNQPVQYSLEWGEITYPGAYSSAGNLSLSAFGAYACSGSASARSTYDFQPQFNNLLLDVTAGWDGSLLVEVMFKLDNKSTGTQLLFAQYDYDYARSNDPNWQWGGGMLMKIIA